MSFLKNLFGNKLRNDYLKDAEILLSVCRSFGIQERTNLKVCTAVALAFLVADAEQKEEEAVLPLLLSAMAGQRRLTEKETGVASLYNLWLMGMQKQAHGSSSPINNLIASGIPVWLISIRATVRVEVLPHARALWTIIENCDALHYDDEIDRIENNLAGHPMQRFVRNAKTFGVPELFVAR